MSVEEILKTHPQPAAYDLAVLARCIDECGSIMTSRRIRHLPVTGPDGLCGVITSGDVLAFQVAEQQATIAQLNSYVFDVR